LSDIRGIDPFGEHRDIVVDNTGSVYTTGRVFKSDTIVIPGIPSSGTYASGDAFGTQFAIQGVPTHGTIATVVYIDHANDGLTKDLVLFSAPFTGTADNAAFNVSDDELRNVVGVVRISTWYTFGSNQIGQGTPALYYSTRPEFLGTLYGQFVTRGADSFATAAGHMPEFFFTVVD